MYASKTPLARISSFSQSIQYYKFKIQSISSSILVRSQQTYPICMDESRIFLLLKVLLLLLRMRLFVHLTNFPNSEVALGTPIKILQKYDNNDDRIVFLEIGGVDTTDLLLDYLLGRLGLAENQCIIRVVLVGNLSVKKVRLVSGWKFKDYCSLLGDTDSNMAQFQLQLEIQLIEGTKKQALKIENGSQLSNGVKSEEASQEMAEIYKFSNQLFQILLHDDLFELKNLVSVLLKYKSPTVVRSIFNLYSPQTGYTLLHTAIFHNKHEYFSQMLSSFGNLVNVNYRSLDGWLPFQLALIIGNKRVIDTLLSCRTIDLNLNYPTRGERISFKLINSMNLSLIQQVIKKAPLYFQQLNIDGITTYDYLWSHKRFTEAEKRDILQLMHQKHLQFYDYYRLDLILYGSCRNYLPSASRRLSPKKEVIYNPNLKIISGEVIKCRVPPHFSKNIFLSVNCYIGGLEEYDISQKLALKNDRQKIEEYEKTRHLSIEELESIEIMPAKDKSWYMKKQWFCFVIKQRRGARTVYACLHQSAAHQWVSQIQQAVTAWSSLEHKEYNPKVAKNYIHIADSQIQANSTKRIEGRGYIDLFSKRLSLYQPMENPQLTQSMKAEKEEVPMIKSKSHYNTLTTKTSMNQEAQPLSLQYRDFKMLQLLGEGSFGQVFLVECLRNKKFYALKTFSKKKIILSKQTKFVIAQVNILKQIKHPFIITLHFTFQTPSYIYLGLEYCQGKDLAKHINQELTFPEADVKIYAAEIVLALEYIHQLGIIYRDLKPENIMLGRDGHVMLVDFGLSKKTENNFAKTFCGSPAYLSPEMLDKLGVGPQTDYFSLGVVIFELIFGQPPFYSQNIHLLYENIQNGVLSFPRKLNETTKDFIQKLLQKDPKKRLGSGSMNQIKNHPYFAEIDWHKLMRKQFTAPQRILLDEIESVESEEELINMFHQDFDYSEQNYKINRFKNFSFIREDEFS